MNPTATQYQHNTNTIPTQTTLTQTSNTIQATTLTPFQSLFQTTTNDAKLTQQNIYTIPVQTCVPQRGVLTPHSLVSAYKAVRPILEYALNIHLQEP